MATDLANLQALKSKYIAALLAGDTQPSYSIDGKSVQWPEYYEKIFNRLQKVNDLLAMEAPFELHSRGVS